MILILHETHSKYFMVEYTAAKVKKISFWLGVIFIALKGAGNFDIALYLAER